MARPEIQINRERHRLGPPWSADAQSSTHANYGQWFACYAE
jgi:hypothetical protein